MTFWDRSFPLQGCHITFSLFFAVLPDAVLAGELLLALHLRLGAGQHDPCVHRDARARRLPQRPLLRPLRVDGPDDHEPQPRGLRARQVSSMKSDGLSAVFSSRVSVNLPESR